MNLQSYPYQRYFAVQEEKYVISVVGTGMKLNHKYSKLIGKYSNATISWAM